MSLFPWSVWLAAVLLAIVYVRFVLARNRRLVPPPVLGRDGQPIPEHSLDLSDGEAVSCLAVGPSAPAGTLLLIPGADGIKETFRFQIPVLAARYRVLCATLRSHFAPGDTLDRMVDDATELADRFDAGRLILVGQSLGGAIAMRFAVRHPERVQALVLINTLARVGYEHVGLNRTLLAPLAMATTRYLPTWLGRSLARRWSRLEVWIFDASPGSERVIDYALWTGPRTVPASVSSARVDRLEATDLRPQLGAIQAPTLVLKGPRDHYVPPVWAREVASLIPGARYEEVSGTGHCSHVSMPGSFNRCLTAWLDEVVEAATAAGIEDVE